MVEGLTASLLVTARASGGLIVRSWQLEVTETMESEVIATCPRGTLPRIVQQSNSEQTKAGGVRCGAEHSRESSC